MKVVPAKIPDVLVIEPDVFGDDRGFFYESYNKQKFADATGIQDEFVQDNHSRSRRGVLRGLHYQTSQPQGKLVRVCTGEVFDVAVDLRRSSPDYGRWVGVVLSADNKKQMWIPKGFAHGFLALSEAAEILYKTTDYWAPGYERCIRWDDEDLAISWPLSQDPIVSGKDERGVIFSEAEVFA